MKKILFLVLFTSFLSLFITSCSSDDAADSNGVTTGNYWPMAVNNQWTYKDNGVLTTPSKIIGTDTFGGVTYYQIQEANTYNLQTWIAKKGATYFIKVGALNYVESGVTIKMDSYEYPVLKDDVPVASTWSGTLKVNVTGTSGGNTVPMTANIKYTGNITEKDATVVVNGVSYPNVIKLTLKQEVSIQNQTTIVESVYWYAKNVGPIYSKTILDNVTTESVLVSFILNN